MSQPRRTQFDYFRRNVVLVVGIALLVVIVVTVTFASGATLPERRVSGERPRNIDVWMIYPDDGVRFATLFYPETTQEGVDQVVDVVDAAGPLYGAESDITFEEAIGADLLETTQDSIEANPDLLYTLYTMDYTRSEAPYGIVVETTNSPYTIPFNIQGSDSWQAQFFATPQQRFAQVIVAVALPDTFSNVSTQNPNGDLSMQLQPYRRATVEDWTVYYFDTTDVTSEMLIYVEYTPTEQEPEPLDPRLVDRRR